MAARTKGNETTQEANTEPKKKATYKVVGKSFESKTEANDAVREAHKKDYKGTGLYVKDNEFVLLFGTYESAADARANLEAVKAAGFDDAKIE